ncbi:MAG: single-stranded DNA-binding protein [Anaerotignum sp.]|nr:single-stranded DNA-binding protein [Anaerotignum sp.]
MIQICTVGRVTADIEVKEGKGSSYARFSLAVSKGFGESRHTIYLDVVAFEEAARRLRAAKVKKGSQIMIAGDLDVKEFTRRDESKGMSNEVTLSFWSYVGGKGNKAHDKEEQKLEYKEHYCSDDEDLPL